MACVVDSMGVLVADIWVVAKWNYLSQDVTSSRASHSSLKECMAINQYEGG